MSCYAGSWLLHQRLQCTFRQGSGNYNRPRDAGGDCATWEADAADSMQRSKNVLLTCFVMSAGIAYVPSENAVPNVLNESTPLISRVLRDDSDGQESWNQIAARKTREIVKRNTGLLLIAVAQSFFSSMNVAVKILNSLDPPVSTMQVRQSCRLLVF